MSKNNWYVITGGPSTGKTTLLDELKKLGHTVFPEAARTVIDQGLADGLTLEQIRADEKAFQDKVARMKQQVENEHDPSVLTFFDRGMHDTMAYLELYAFKVENWVKQLMHESSYKKVFLLDPVPTFVKDYARTENEEQALKLNDLLDKAYRDAGMNPIHVPLLPPKKRAQFVLNHVEQNQQLKEQAA